MREQAAVAVSYSPAGLYFAQYMCMFTLLLHFVYDGAGAALEATSLGIDVY